MSDDFIRGWLHLNVIGGFISGVALLVYLAWAWFYYRRKP